jgi:hypothetical protein
MRQKSVFIAKFCNEISDTHKSYLGIFCIGTYNVITHT